jgi:hypothetical protein
VTAATARRAATYAAALALAAVCGCDNPYQQFLGSIPTEEVDPDAPVEVFLGVDGLSKQAFDLARARGAFADYHAADLITPFPGTSDYSWTRTLRAGALGGYELQYFDPQANSMENRGLVGVAEHPLREGIADTLPAYQRFDFLGDGETWMLDSYLDPVASLRPTLDQMFDTIAARGRTKSRVMAYLLNVDVVGHLGGLDQAVTMLVEIDRRIRAFKADHRRRFQFTLFADHGNAHQRSQLVDPVRILTDVGIASVDALSPAPAADATAPLEAVAVVHVRVN